MGKVNSSLALQCEKRYQFLKCFFFFFFFSHLQVKATLKASGGHRTQTNEPEFACNPHAEYSCPNEHDDYVGSEAAPTTKSSRVGYDDVENETADQVASLPKVSIRCANKKRKLLHLTQA
jgi:hypothetical protein